MEDHLAPQRSLRSRFDDFKRALERRDRAAYELALRDFQAGFKRWSEAEEPVLLAALLRAPIPGRDPQRELRLEYVQVRELARYLLDQVRGNAPMGDLLGLVENLDRRLGAHETEMERVYYPAALGAFTDAERRALADSARSV